MNHTLNIMALNQPAVLERLLRVTRHRGFQVTDLTMHPTAEQKLEISFAVNSDKPIQLLEKQLNKLFDVATVQVQSAAAMQCSA